MSEALRDIPHSRPWITTDDLTAVQETLASEMIASGAEVRRWEQAVAARVGASRAMSFANCRTALQAALLAVHAGPGREVLLPTYVCDSVAAAVAAVGATPVYCDIGDRWNLTAETAAPHVTSRTAALIAVHTFGRPADIAALRRIPVPIIEDCAQAFGLQLELGCSAGVAGDYGVYSFHATKCLTSGEGGMAVARDADRWRRLEAVRSERPAALPGLSDLQAALGAAQLRRYDTFLERRRKLAEFYRAQLPAEWTRAAFVEPAGIWFRLPLTVDADFEQVRAALAAEQVQVRRGVDALLHRRAGLPADRFPNAERRFQTTLSIPIYPALAEEEAARVAAVLLRHLPH